MIFLKLLLSFLGGWTSRMVGGSWPNIYLPAQWVFALPYGIIFTGSWWGIPAYLGAAVGKREASYPYFLMGNTLSVNTSRVPPLDFIVRFFFGPISPSGGQYWRSVAGFAIEGVSTTIVAGGIYAWQVNTEQGFLIALSGLLKPLAYMIELAAYKAKIWPQQAALGEFLDGVFLWGALAWVL